MNIPEKIAAIGKIITAKNSNGGNSPSLGNQFLRNGNRRELGQDWSSILVTDEQLYSGYIYAAIRNRANGITQLAANSLRTDAEPKTLEKAKKAGLEVRHPYLDIIDSSKSFSNYELWYELSTYLDLEGVYYLMAVRTVVNSGTEKVRVGNIQSFVLLNPYQVTPILDKDNLSVVGYIEQRRGLRREIPKEMIIEIRDLNPFDKTKPYSLTDAAKDYQYTLNQSGDFTRHSLRNNMAAPGIISTGVILSDEDFIRFQDRIKSTEKGQPLFGNGAGAIDYKSMQNDLDRAALEKISAINVEALLAVTGMSKTMLGIEVSGVTRDTSRVQSDLFISMQNMPRLQLIIDAFNQDYKNYYAKDYDTNKYRLFIDSPLGTDRDAESTDISNRRDIYNVCTTLVNEGYNFEAAARYAAGEITLEELGEPTNPPKKDLDLTPTRITDTGAGTPVTPETVAADTTNARNSIDSTQILVDAQTSSLQNTIVQIEARVAAAVSQKVANAYDSQSDIISDKDRQDLERELVTALVLFYGVVLPIQAGVTMSKRAKEYGKLGSFKTTPAVQQAINQSAQRASSSHMDTILQDLLEAVQVAQVSGGDVSAVVDAVQKKYPDESAQAIQANLRTAAEKASRDGGKQAQRVKATAENLGKRYKDVADQELFAAVRTAALAGANQTELQAAIRKEYADISKTRAKAIARTETNRAFSMSQFEADKQFLAQNDLEGQAYKLWVTRSPNPCPFCSAQAARGPIPFDTNFASVGDVLKANVTRDDGSISVRQMQVTYADLEAGNAHVNCSCSYQLIIRAN